VALGPDVPNLAFERAVPLRPLETVSFICFIVFKASFEYGSAF